MSSSASVIEANGQVAFNLPKEEAKRIERPIHYLGSKLRMLEFIQGHVNTLAPQGSVVCDLFAGSGTVSLMLSEHHPVISVDIQEYARVLCSALLNRPNGVIQAGQVIDDAKKNTGAALLRQCFSGLIAYEEELLKASLTGTNHGALFDIVENGSILSHGQEEFTGSAGLDAQLGACNEAIAGHTLLDSPLTMVTRYFGGLYFSYKQAVDIDILLEEIFKYTGHDRDTLLAALLTAVSEIVNTVGKQFAQPLKVKNADGSYKTNLLKKIIDDRSLDVMEIFEAALKQYLRLPPGNYQHQAWKADYSDALDRLAPCQIGLVYADPPYTRYHYSRYYHVLETIVLRDNPIISTTFRKKSKLSRGIYRTDRHQSPFSIKSKAGDAFTTLFEKAHRLGAPFVLSYSPYSEKETAPRLQTIDQLMEKAGLFYRDVKTASPGQFSHSKLNSAENNGLKEQEAELLLICKDIR